MLSCHSPIKSAPWYHVRWLEGEKKVTHRSSLLFFTLFMNQIGYTPVFLFYEATEALEFFPCSPNFIMYRNFPLLPKVRRLLKFWYFIFFILVTKFSPFPLYNPFIIFLNKDALIFLLSFLLFFLPVHLSLFPFQMYHTAQAPKMLCVNKLLLKCIRESYPALSLNHLYCELPYKLKKDRHKTWVEKESTLK